MRQAFRIAVLIGACLLAACGNKGPLVVPDQNKNKQDHPAAPPGDAAKPAESH